jgi:hypothetical protein
MHHRLRRSHSAAGLKSGALSRKFAGCSPPSHHYDEQRNGGPHAPPYPHDKWSLPQRRERIDARRFRIARQVEDADLVTEFERGEGHGDVRVDDVQAAVVRREAKLRDGGAGPGPGGSHRLHPDYRAVRAQRSVNELRAMHGQVDSEKQTQRTRNTKEPDQAVRE